LHLAAFFIGALGVFFDPLEAFIETVYLNMCQSVANECIPDLLIKPLFVNNKYLWQTQTGTGNFGVNIYPIFVLCGEYRVSYEN